MCQVYELDAFKVTHATKYPGPVLSVALSPNAALLAVGLADGQLFVRKHSHNKGAVPCLPGTSACTHCNPLPVTVPKCSTAGGKHVAHVKRVSEAADSKNCRGF